MTSLKNILLVFLVISVAFRVANSNQELEIAEESGVLILTDDNYEAAISKYPALLVKFYAPWCGHCKKLAPEFEKAAEELKKTDLNVRLAKLDCTIHHRASSVFGIEGYPTLKFFKGTITPTDYNSDRSAEAIVAWINKKVGPIVTKVDDLAVFENFIEEKEVVIVYFGDNEDESNIFTSVAQNNENLLFLSTLSSQISSIHNKQSKKVILYKKFDELTNEFDDEFNAENLEKFIENNSFPLISGFNEDTIDYLFNKQKSGIYLYRTKGVHDEEEKLVKDLALKYKGKLITIITGITDEIEQKLAEYMDITEKDLPCIKIHDVIGEELRKYSMSGPITVDNIDEFVSKFLKGELVPEYKSEDVTEQPADEATIKVVGKTFDKIVKDTSKDVLVIFHAPWCGHCKSFLPKLERVAKLIQSIDSFVIAKFDATANEIPGLNIEGYPTIKFYPSSSKDTPIDYNKGRNENDILDFLREFHTINSISENIKVEVEPENQDGEKDILSDLLDQGDVSDDESENQDETNNKDETEGKDDL